MAPIQLLCPRKKQRDRIANVNQESGGSRSSQGGRGCPCPPREKDFFFLFLFGLGQFTDLRPSPRLSKAKGELPLRRENYRPPGSPDRAQATERIVLDFDESVTDFPSHRHKERNCEYWCRNASWTPRCCRFQKGECPLRKKKTAQAFRGASLGSNLQSLPPDTCNLDPPGCKPDIRGGIERTR